MLFEAEKKTKSGIVQHSIIISTSNRFFSKKKHFNLIFDA